MKKLIKIAPHAQGNSGTTTDTTTTKLRQSSAKEPRSSSKGTRFQLEGHLAKLQSQLETMQSQNSPKSQSQLGLSSTSIKNSNLQRVPLRKPPPVTSILQKQSIIVSNRNEPIKSKPMSSVPEARTSSQNNRSKRDSSHDYINMSSETRTAEKAKSSVINHTASVQYYSTTNKKKSIGDSEPIINLSAGSQIYTDQKASDNVQEGIQYLQQNLKQLEGKYQDLAQFYQNKPSPERSPSKKVKRTPRSDSSDKASQKYIKRPQSSGQQHLAMPKQKYQEQEEYQLMSEIMNSKNPINNSLEQLLSTYKHRLQLEPNQTQIYDSLQHELQQMQAASKHFCTLDVEYMQVATKEAIFQIRHLSVQVILDIKKAMQSEDLVTTLTLAQEKLSNQGNHIGKLEQLQANLSQSVKQLQTSLTPLESASSNSGRSSAQLDLKQQISIVKESSTKQVTQMEKTITELKIQNVDLRTKMDIFNADIRQKQLMLTQREHQHQQSLTKLKQSMTSRDSQPSEWRVQLETLVYLSTRFLNTMRKLQKVVHKKETNVQAEKMEFEKSKKDLELTLKQTAQALRSQAQPQSSSNQNDSINDRVSSVSFKLQSEDNAQSARLSSHPQLSLQKKQSSSSINPSSFSNNQQMKEVKEMCEVVSRQQNEFILSTYKIESMSKRLSSLTGSHQHLKQLIQQLKGQIKVQIQTIKTKDKDLQVIKQELTHQKSEFKQSLHTKDQSIEKLEVQIQALTLQVDCDKDSDKVHRTTLEDLKLHNGQLEQQVNLLREQHLNQVNKLRQELQSKLETIVVQNQSNIEKQSSQFEEQLSALIKEHKLQLYSQVSDFENTVTKISQLKQRIDQLEIERGSLQIRISEQDLQLFESQQQNDKVISELRNENKSILGKYQELLDDQDLLNQEHTKVKGQYQSFTEHVEVEMKQTLKKHQEEKDNLNNNQEIKLIETQAEIDISNLQEQLTELQQQLDNKTSESQLLYNEINEISESKLETEQQLQKSELELSESNKQLSELRNGFVEFEKLQQICTIQIKNQDQTIQSLNQEIKDYQIKIEQLQNELQSQNQSLGEDLLLAETKQTKFRSINENLVIEVESLQDQLANLETQQLQQLSSKDQQIQDQQSKITGLEVQVACPESADQIQQLQQLLQQSTHQLEILKQTNEEYLKCQTQLARDIVSHKQQSDDLQHLLDQTRSDLQDTNQILDESNSLQQQLQTELESQATVNQQLKTQVDKQSQELISSVQQLAVQQKSLNQANQEQQTNSKQIILDLEGQLSESNRGQELLKQTGQQLSEQLVQISTITEQYSEQLELAHNKIQSQSKLQSKLQQIQKQVQLLKSQFNTVSQEINYNKKVQDFQYINKVIIKLNSKIKSDDKLLSLSNNNKSEDPPSTNSKETQELLQTERNQNELLKSDLETATDINDQLRDEIYEKESQIESLKPQFDKLSETLKLLKDSHQVEIVQLQEKMHTTTQQQSDGNTQEIITNLQKQLDIQGDQFKVKLTEQLNEQQNENKVKMNETVQGLEEQINQQTKISQQLVEVNQQTIYELNQKLSSDFQQQLQAITFEFQEQSASQKAEINQLIDQQSECKQQYEQELAQLKQSHSTIHNKTQLQISQIQIQLEQNQEHSQSQLSQQNHSHALKLKSLCSQVSEVDQTISIDSQDMDKYFQVLDSSICEIQKQRDLTLQERDIKEVECQKQAEQVCDYAMQVSNLQMQLLNLENQADDDVLRLNQQLDEANQQIEDLEARILETDKQLDEAREQSPLAQRQVLQKGQFLNDSEEDLQLEVNMIQTARNFTEEMPEDNSQEIQKEQFLSDQDDSEFKQIVDDMQQSQHIQLKEMLELANQQIANLQQQIITSQSSQQHSQVSEIEDAEQDDDEGHLLEHVKGTLTQFLKMTPITERQNEELLKIIYSMMKFTKAEQTELSNARLVLKGNNKIAQALAIAHQNSSKGGGANSSDQNISSSGHLSFNEEKKKKGLFSIFNKNKNQNDRSKEITQPIAPQPKPTNK